jgi:transcriptional regulator with XRE-family HTH domain
MDEARVGTSLRAIRLRLGQGQAEVAARARISQSTVSRIERGRLAGVRVDSLESVATSLEASIQLTLRWRGSRLDRLLDARHVRLVDLVTRTLTAGGWSVEVEYTFNHYGDRGSVDVLAWQPDQAALLLIEVKTRIVDVQDLLSTVGRKRRVVPPEWSAETRRRPAAVGSVLVVPDATVHRRVVAEHSAVFEAALPGRSADVTRWLSAPHGNLNAIWFVRDSPTVTRRGSYAGEFRVRRSRAGSGATVPRSLPNP